LAVSAESSAQNITCGFGINPPFGIIALKGKSYAIPTGDLTIFFYLIIIGYRGIAYILILPDMNHSLDQKLKSRAVHRAKIIKGQLDGLIKAIEGEEYCPTLMEQSLSIQRSLKSLDTFLLENHLRSHVKHQMQNNGESEKAVKELIKVYTLSNK